METKDRIKEVRKSRNLSQREFGKRISISDSAVSKLESGENSPSDQTLRLISQEFRVSYPWLKNGIGDMEVPEDEDAAVYRVLLGGSDFQKWLLRKMCNQPQWIWEAMESFFSDLKKDGQ